MKKEIKLRFKSSGERERERLVWESYLSQETNATAWLSSLCWLFWKRRA